jgi:hypothetical protein
VIVLTTAEWEVIKMVARQLDTIIAACPDNAECDLDDIMRIVANAKNNLHEAIARVGGR